MLQSRYVGAGYERQADWRQLAQLQPLTGIDVNWSQFVRLIHAVPLIKLDAFRKKVFPGWGCTA
ncbi:MAG: hypothetical protein PHG00_12730 [Methylococcales bacterium]|nr:hypothetical protein [Methylococcales bacterium]